MRLNNERHCYKSWTFFVWKLVRNFEVAKFLACFVLFESLLSKQLQFKGFENDCLYQHQYKCKCKYQCQYQRQYQHKHQYKCSKSGTRVSRKIVQTESWLKRVSSRFTPRWQKFSYNFRIWARKRFTHRWQNSPQNWTTNCVIINVADIYCFESM